MQTILLLGAGRSSSSLIKYLLNLSRNRGWRVIVGDASPQLAQGKTLGAVNASAIHFNIEDPESTRVIEDANVVISLLPPTLHPLVAIKCLEYKKHLLTASYVSEEMKQLDKEAHEKNLLFLNECGLDPGIDHMSAMQVIDRIRQQNGRLLSFESFTGGLIAPETDPENPWRYKFTWNPRNVVMAGQGTAKYLHEGEFKYIPYQQLFKRTTRIEIPTLGDFEGYANRDSLKYIQTYNLAGIRTMVRGTLRHKGFCSAWNVFVQLGCCDDSYEMDGVADMTHRDFINAFVEGSDSQNVEEKLAKKDFVSADDMLRLKWSGFFSKEKVGLEKGTPAQILEHILNKRWKLIEGDKDRIVMWHRFVFEQEGRTREIHASLVATGTDSINTAMAQTVGLPLGMAARLLLENKIRTRGVVSPTTEEIYEPVLRELAEYGIQLSEREL